MFPLQRWVGHFQQDPNDGVILAEVCREVEGCNPNQSPMH